jgi:hypothetical protein
MLLIFKPSYILHENKLTVYRSRFIAISFTSGGLLGFFALLIFPVMSVEREVNVYIVIFYLLMLYLVIHCFKYLFDYEVKFEISTEGIFVKNTYLKWEDITMFEWNYRGGTQGILNLNFYIVESNNPTKPIEYIYELDVFLEYKFKNKLFEPFLCEILKNYPHIQVGKDYCLCKKYWEDNNIVN